MKLQKSNAQPSIYIEQGMVSPRDNSIGWRFWCECENIEEARKQVQREKSGIWRIVEARELFTAAPAGVLFTKAKA